MKKAIVFIKNVMLWVYGDYLSLFTNKNREALRIYSIIYQNTYTNMSMKNNMVLNILSKNLILGNYKAFNKVLTKEKKKGYWKDPYYRNEMVYYYFTNNDKILETYENIKKHDPIDHLLIAVYFMKRNQDKHLKYFNIYNNTTSNPITYIRKFGIISYINNPIEEISLKNYLLGYKYYEEGNYMKSRIFLNKINKKYEEVYHKSIPLLEEINQYES